MKKIAYSEKLKDPRWQKKRLEVFQRDSFTCQRCFSQENTLTVHHKRYEKGKDPWEYPIENLVTLCQDCHQEEFEGQYSAEDYLIKVLRLAGFFNTDLESLACVFYDESTGTSPKLHHCKEVVMNMIGWIVENEEIQREMLHRYFQYVESAMSKHSTKR